MRRGKTPQNGNSMIIIGDDETGGVEWISVVHEGFHSGHSFSVCSVSVAAYHSSLWVVSVCHWILSTERKFFWK